MLIKKTLSNTQFIERQKYAQNIWSWNLVHEDPYGYRVVHHGYILTSVQDKMYVLSV